MGFLASACVFAVVCLLALEPDPTDAHTIFPHPLSKHSFTEISKCAGAYDLNFYAQLTEICYNCFNLYRDPEIFRECRYSLPLKTSITNDVTIYLTRRKDCFNNDYFKGCVDVLQIPEMKEKIVEGLSVIHPHLGQNIK